MDTPWMDSSPSQGTVHTHSFTPKDNFSIPSSTTSMYLGGVRKLENLEETYIDMANLPTVRNPN